MIDERSYTNLKPEQANVFFKLMEERYYRHSTIITTNLAYEEWPGLLGNKNLWRDSQTGSRLCLAVVRSRRAFRCCRERAGAGVRAAAGASPGGASVGCDPLACLLLSKDRHKRSMSGWPKQNAASSVAEQKAVSLVLNSSQLST